MTLQREDLLTRYHAQDPAHDGEFVIGVLTTGIYCLPSCRARKPKPENVVFFENEEQARADGLRACKRCRPDHFYRRYDPERERLERVAGDVRRAPADFPDVRAIAGAAGVGVTKLTGLFRDHLHTTPATFLQRARVARAARELARRGVRPLDASLAAGFESPSAFHQAFRRWTAMSPAAFQRMTGACELVLRLPEGFAPDDLFALFGRNAEGTSERVTGRRATKALLLDGRPMRLELAFARGSVRCRVESGGRPSARLMLAAHAALLRMLGLVCDPGPFERRAARERGWGRLVRGRGGLRIPLHPDAFECLVWVIVGQQVNLSFASTCRSRLIELCGRPAGAGFVAHPAPEDVARLDVADLTRCQYSRRKAEYLIDTARAIARGALDLEGLRGRSVASITETLDAVRGLGPWSIQYLLMRAYGFEDCIPVGDAGLVAALQRFFGLDERPDAAETQRLMAPFAPHRSLATFHLWKSLGDP